MQRDIDSLEREANQRLYRVARLFESPDQADNQVEEKDEPNTYDSGSDSGGSGEEIAVRTLLTWSRTTNESLFSHGYGKD